MIFLHYVDKKGTLLAFGAYETFDIHYALYKYEKGHIRKLIQHENYIEVWLRAFEPMRLVVDEEYSVCVDSQGFLIGFDDNVSIPSDWKKSGFSRRVLKRYLPADIIENPYKSPTEELYYSVDSLSSEDEHKTAEEIEKELDEIHKKEMETTEEAPVAYDLYFSIKKTGFYS